MTATYAKETAVPARRSRDEIEKILQRYGATDFALGQTGSHAVAAFVMRGRHIKIMLPLPDPESREFTHTPTGKVRRDAYTQEAAYEQATRSKWRSLVLILKAKLEAVAAGVVTFEQEFGMHMVLPDGRTVSEHVVPAIAEAYATGEVPSLLGPMDSRPALPRQ